MPNVVNDMLNAYYTTDRAIQGREAGNLNRLQGVLAMRGALMNQQQKQAEIEKDAAFRSELEKLGLQPDVSQVANLAMRYGKPELAVNMFRTMEGNQTRLDVATQQARAAEERRQANEQLRRDMFEQGKIAAEDRRSANEALRRDMQQIAIQNRPPRNIQIVPTTQGYMTAEQALESGAMPPSSARIDYQASNQLQRQYNAAVKPTIDALGAASVYRNARASGDTAQSTLMAAEALRRSARSGNTRFKGEAEKILGGGYGGGSLVERLENFLSTELRGTPSNETLSRLDRLIDATETANLEQMSRQAKFYSSGARGRGLKLQHVTGQPFVQGAKVVFPDGTFATFKSGTDAEGAAQKWLEANQ